MKPYRTVAAVAIALVASTGVSDAQQVDMRTNLRGVGVVKATPGVVQIIEAAPGEAVTPVRNAPFWAEAVTEFTQVLGDGNRIERRFVSSVARDSRGRTRREEELALVGPFAPTGPSPKLVSIIDPDARFSYTLDENQRVAYRNPIALTKLQDLVKSLEGAKIARAPIAVAPADPAAASVHMESLGTRSIEGVTAEGTRTTSTIPAGAIGNLQPIETVTERWFSRELQMAVLIVRRDPRAGETVYRLTNIVRAEPPDDLFTVPPSYEIRDGQLGLRVLKKVEPAGGGRGVAPVLKK